MITGKKIFIYVLFYLIFAICCTIKKDKKIKFKCNSDKIESKPMPAKNSFPIPKNVKFKRVLDSNGFKDFNIYLDLVNFEHEAGVYDISVEVKEIFIKGMQKAVETLKSLLRVKQLENNYYFTDEQIIQLGINYWNKTNIGTEPKSQNKGILESGIDLFIFVRFGNNNELGEYTLASAGAKFYDSPSGQPIIGVANINRDISYNIGNSLQYFQATILHEFIHILGFANYFFDNFYHNVLKKEDSFGVQRIYLNSTKVVEVAKKYYNCDSIEGVELENYGGTGTTGSHWEERILLGDIMNGVVYPEEQVISEFTLAVLEDSGYYKPNYYTGGLMQFGKNKGCQFLTEKCVINENGDVDVKFKNEFFDQALYYSNVDPGCSSGRQSRAYHAIYEYDEDISEPFNYYSNSKLGGRASTDYCPVSQEYYEEVEIAYYVGHCSSKGNGEYGTLIKYYDSKGNKIFKKNGDISNISGEIHSNHSFCVLSSLFPNNIENSQKFSETVNAFCYPMSCSDQSLTIQINNDFLVCPRAGGKINAINYNGYLLCPDYYLICSGTTLCNDLFDCVEKKSLLKTDIQYDYIINTSQDINDADKESFSEDSYELATNGICPKFCSQCDNQHYCIKCKSDYGVVQIVEDETIKRICMEISTLNVGYYQDKQSLIYYKCIDNCQKCQNGQECEVCINNDYIVYNNICILKIEHCISYENNGQCIECEELYKVKANENICERGEIGCKIFDVENNKCTSCEDDYIKIGDKCYKKVINCEQYTNNGECSQCSTRFAFEENDRLNCKEKNQFAIGYYTKDDEKSFFKCENTDTGGINQCTECSYENEELKCNKCSNDYIFLDDETNICQSKNECNNQKCFEIDENHYYRCSKGIEDCEKCEKKEANSITCKECKKDYRLSNNFCYPIIQNCKTYVDNENMCSVCKNGFAFEGNNRTSCKNLIDFIEYFSKDNGISYLKCDDTTNGGIENCGTCEYNSDNNELICKKCKTNYILKDDEKKICYSNSDYQNNNHYYYEDDYHVKTCSKNINNCVECEKSDNILKCNVCNSDYSIVNDEIRYCKETSEIPSFIYYLEGNEYFSCLIYHTIQNCKNCENKENCNLCDIGYTFINNEKLVCKNIEELGLQYIMDESDNTIYRKCSEYMQNCDTCSSKDKCLTCISQFGLYKDRKTCINLDDKKHYLNDEDNLYYLCEENGIENCETCLAKNICLKCIEGYVKLNNDKSECHLFSEINTEEYYIDPKDENNYIQCSTYVKNCYSCEYSKGCNKCNTGYIMLNENKQFCHEKEKTDLTGYFSNDNITYYSCKETKYKNNIQCFTLIPEQIIILTFLQVQIVNKKLFCYMITHSPLPKDFSIKLKINLYQNRMRYLEGQEREIVLSAIDDSNGSQDKIVSFTSNDEYTEEQNVQIKEINFNSADSVTKTVTDNNLCTLKFDSTSNLVDTKKVKTLIAENKLPDCSTSQKSNIISLTMDKVVNCEFNLNSEEKVSFTNDKLVIDLIESDNSENLISAECDTKKNNIQSIKCSIQKDDKTEINSEYSFKDEILLDSEQYITLSSEQSKFKIFCEKKQSKKTLMYIIIAAIVVIIIIVSLITLIIVCKKDKKNSKENNNIYEKKGFETIPTQNLRTQTKTGTKRDLVSINIEKEENDGNMNVNINDNKKRRHHRSKTKKNTVKSRKEKKNKTVKVRKNTEE